MKNKSTETPKEKKLKQARLPFQVLSTRSTGSEGPPASKKRKLSTSIEDKQNVKKVAHVKENLKSENQSNTVDIVEIDSDDDIQVHTENILENSKSNQIEADDVEFVDKQEQKAVSDSYKKEEHIQIDAVPDIGDNDKIKPESDGPSEEKVQLSLVIGDNNITINKNSDKQNYISETISEKETEHESSICNNDEDDASDLIEIESEDEESKSFLDVSMNSNPNESIINCTATSSNVSETDDILESSETSNIITPNEKRTRKCVTPYDESVQAKKGPVAKKTLTPKQLQRKLEFAKAREEKEKARQESIRKKQEEKLKRKLEKDEEKKKEREEKEKEREEKEKKRLAELEKKNEEKRLKDEEKRIRDEEKRKKEEQKEEERRKKEQEKEEAENKKKKAAAAFVNFFVPKKTAEEKNVEDDIYIKVAGEEADKDKVQSFMPFCVKADMRLAPVVRKTLSNETKKKLEHVLQNEGSHDSHTINYLESIKKEKYKLGKYGKTWPISEEVKDDLMIMDEVGESFVEVLRPTPSSKAKLILFHENRRPPYWGTWTKKSNDIGPRTPFGKDKIFDYEVDSDSEWEEEEPGESLHGSDDEKDKEESEDEYEVDNDFFVPHGYLSDEEQNDEEKEPDSPEIQKAKLKLLQTEFNEEMKKKTEKIKPRLVGCVWADQNSERPQKCAEIIWSLLCNNRMIIDEPIVLDTTEEMCSLGEDVKATGSLSKKTKLHEDLIPDLIKLLHGNINGRKFLVHEYQAYLQNSKESVKDNKSLFEVSNIAIARKIKEIGEYKMCREDLSNINRKCWCVDKTIRENYKLADLSLINSWKYILTPKNKEKQIEGSIAPEKSECTVDKTKHGNNIKKFTTVLSAEDRQKQFIPSTVVNADEENCSIESQVTSEQKLKKVVKRKTAFKKKVISSQNTTPQPQPTNVNKATVVPRKRSSITNSTTNKDAQSVSKKRAKLISVPLGTQIPPEARNYLSSVKETEVKNTLMKHIETKVEDSKTIIEVQEQTTGSEKVETTQKKKIPLMFLGSLKSTTTKQKETDDGNLQSITKYAANESLVESNSISKAESACTNTKNAIKISEEENGLMEIDTGNTSIVLSD